MAGLLNFALLVVYLAGLDLIRANDTHTVSLLMWIPEGDVSASQGRVGVHLAWPGLRLDPFRVPAASQPASQWLAYFWAQIWAQVCLFDKLRDLMLR